ncbi:MAG: putative bifunctional diguanylate cyclase/phosphodiesterase, partial [Geminicoccaceae bacterium]
LQLFADLALYRAKDEGRGIAVRFEPKMAETHFQRFVMGDELKTALNKKEIRVAFQSVHDLADRSVADRSVKGVEALVRWNNHERGWIPPLDILAIAENRELLPALTRYIIRESLTQSKDLIERCLIDWVSINLTAQDLRDRTLTDFIIDTLDTCKIAPHHVKIEITEHTVVSDAENAYEVIAQLSRIGVRFAIDDFGTGYSNLMTLNRLPFHTLKVDQSFVASIEENNEAQTIVKAMIDLGHALDLSVIAEGIETSKQAVTLQALGCDLGQGFFFGKPLPVNEIRWRRQFKC